jgi:hypothetical protein
MKKEVEGERKISEFPTRLNTSHSRVNKTRTSTQVPYLVHSLSLPCYLAIRLKSNPDVGPRSRLSCQHTTWASYCPINPVRSTPVGVCHGRLAH